MQKSITLRGRKWMGLLLFMWIAGQVQGQQRLQYSQYLLNGFLLNPAVAGVEEYLDLKVGYQHQWVGIPGSPRGLFLTGHKGFVPKVQEDDQDVITSLPAPGRGRYRPTTTKVPGEMVPSPRFRIGLGGSFYSEQTGPLSYNAISAAFSSNLQLKDELRLALGANLELLNYRVNTDEVTLTNPLDPTVNGARNSLILPGINVGFLVYSQSFFVGGSSRQLLQNRITIGPDNPFLSRLAVHFNVMAGYRFRLSDDIRLTASTAFRYVNPAPVSVELGVRLDYQDMLYLGLSYRHRDAVIPMVGFNLNQFVMLNYSYDATISRLGNFSSGSHAITLGVRLMNKENRERRYFW